MNSKSEKKNVLILVICIILYKQEFENKRILQEKDEILSAYYDHLTQMPNRHLFMENLKENISKNKQCAIRR